MYQELWIKCEQNKHGPCEHNTIFIENFAYILRNLVLFHFDFFFFIVELSNVVGRKQNFMKGILKIFIKFLKFVFILCNPLIPLKITTKNSKHI